MNRAQKDNLREAWVTACAGTDLAQVKAFVLDDGLTVEVVRGRV